MKMILKRLILTSIFLTGLISCQNDTLTKDVAPLADAMCRFIEIQNNLKDATVAQDSLLMHRYATDKHKMTVELTILNQEFKEKYGDLVADPEFGKRFRREMNRAMIDCPHLSTEDRERMEAELKE